VLCVRDTGIGMPPDILSRVFDLFVQGDTSLDRSRSGLGIGLALVRQIVTLHGGTIAVSSEGPGRGSEFIVRVPVAAQDGRPIPDAPAAGPAHRRVRVLVVDDQHDVADAVAMLIETLGHSALAVYDGEAALALGREGATDAMFVDIGMPRMTGYELAERVRGDPELKRLQLVALTGYGSDDDRARVARAGFDLHLTKPVNDADLHEALSAIARAGRS
jgi:two-component system CheB/CheR fusion protein